jgi:hypothetical protein
VNSDQIGLANSNCSSLPERDSWFLAKGASILSDHGTQSTMHYSLTTDL